MTPFGPWVVLHRRVKTGVDEYGDSLYSSADVRVQCIYFDSGGIAESPVGFLNTTTPPTLYLAPTIDVSALDGVTVQDVRYEVDGNPPPARINPFTGWQPCIEVHLKLPTG